MGFIKNIIAGIVGFITGLFGKKGNNYYLELKEEAEEAMAYVMECMRFVPAWAEGIPLNCEAGFGDSYGDC
jgi:hypothetical protein